MKFCCYIAKAKGGPAVTLRQVEEGVRGTVRIGRISPKKVPLVRRAIHKALKAAGEKPGYLRKARNGRLTLAQEPGVRLGLLIRVVSGLRPGEAVLDAGDGVARLGNEESLYWYAQVMAKGGVGKRALRALRLFLGVTK